MPAKKRLAPLERSVLKTIRDFGMLSGGELVLVAVSGGPDSIALLHCLDEAAPRLHLTLAVAHLNHGIRGAEADADEGFVRAMSAKLGLPCFVERIELARLAAASKRNLEEFAREKRYDFLNRTAEAAGAVRIAVGHTLDDQAETALFRFLRGSGIEGLGAIHPVVNGTVIRPLLECSRKSILDYLQAAGIQYREDSTNRDFRHSRNRIRLELIPYLQQHFNPKLAGTLARESLIARELWSFVDMEAQKLFDKLHACEGDDLQLRIQGLQHAHPALRKLVLRQALRQYLGSLRGITSFHIRHLVALTGAEQSGARIQLPRGHTAHRQFDVLVLSRDPSHPTGPFAYTLPIPGRCHVPEAAVVIESGFCNTPDMQTMKGTISSQAFLDIAALPKSLIVRSRNPGDRYGGPGHRKVKKLLINARIPMSMRAILPMIVSGEDVLWIPGFRPATRYAAKPDSRECVLIRVSTEDEKGVCPARRE
jgi:tRNA(Ile)-lysidine synthase